MTQEYINRYMFTVQAMQSRGEITWDQMLKMIEELAERMKREGL